MQGFNSFLDENAIKADSFVGLLLPCWTVIRILRPGIAGPILPSRKVLEFSPANPSLISYHLLGQRMKISRALSSRMLLGNWPSRRGMLISSSLHIVYLPRKSVSFFSLHRHCHYRKALFIDQLFHIFVTSSSSSHQILTTYFF